jgi:HK97 family phage portal protein
LGHVMTLFDRIRSAFSPKNELPPPAVKPVVYPEFIGSTYTESGKHVSIETAKCIATAYRCANIISDDIASMPFQMFEKIGPNIERVKPDANLRNMAYLLEVQPNRWMTPFIFKKTWANWLIWRGNAYIWTPPGRYREMFLLNSDATYPVFDQAGTLWYKTRFPSGKEQTIPDVEICPSMINSTDGINGKSILTYARETMGRQLAAQQTQNKLIGRGLTPGGILTVKGVVGDKEARKKLKREFSEEIQGSENSGNIAIKDDMIVDFTPISIKPIDAQFLETIAATNVDILNYFGMPEFKLNQGKQNYESNEQQHKEYLFSTLDPYLVQLEQAGGVKWVRTEEQGRKYFKFIRESLLRMDPTKRAEYKKSMIDSGQMTLNEARQIEDLNPFKGGDAHYFASNMGLIQEDGTILGGVTKETTKEVVTK